MLAITPGDCAAEQLRAAGLATDVLPWRDLLHEGPVPAGLTPAELSTVRARYVAGLGWADPARAGAEFAARDAALATAAARPPEIVLWFDLNLVNRLALLQVLDRLTELRGPQLAGVTLAEPRTFGGTGPTDLHRLFGARRPVTAAMREHAAAAWAAFRAPDPTGLVEHLGSGPLAGLGTALARHLEQFPGATDGLAGTERRALTAVAAGAVDFSAVYRAVTAADDPPWLGDSVLRAHVRRLADAPRPLLRIEPDGRHRLTDDGHTVLAGRADHLALGGVDHWLGGVHLTSGTPWRYDAQQARLLRRPSGPG